MPKKMLPHDPLWPRAGHWLKSAAETPGTADIGLLGVPAHLTSITPTGAHATPGAIREALLRYSTYAPSRDIDLSTLTAIDFGDVADPDGAGGEARVRAAVARAAERVGLLLALGGDNSITVPVATALLGGQAAGLQDGGLVTVDAHHDLRDGETNGSPVRRLIERGLPGARVVQIGIADFSNSPDYSARARALGITVVPRAALRNADLRSVAERAVEIASADGGHVFVDLDVDVCDRAVVPGCPSAAPGGISADELRQLAFAFGSDPRVRGIDITEVDATSDSVDGRTVRLAALLVLEAAAGYATRGVT